MSFILLPNELRFHILSFITDKYEKYRLACAIFKVSMTKPYNISNFDIDKTYRYRDNFKDGNNIFIIPKVSIEIASKYEMITSLDIWKKNGKKLQFTPDVFYLAATNGHITVLNWWKNIGITIVSHSCMAKLFFIASVNSQVHILSWLKDYDPTNNFYTTEILDATSSLGLVNILEWWKNSGLPLKYSTDAMDKASINGHIRVLEWWKNSGLPLKYTKKVKVDSAFVIQWWKNSSLEYEIFEDGDYLNLSLSI